MKILRNSLVALLIVGMGSLTTSCLGSFALTNNVYDWNESATGNKFVNNLIFWAFVIIPVYGVTIAVDAIIFNLIEFWGGSNPIGMEEGDYEVEYHNYAGVSYKIEATQNQFAITQLDGEEEGKVTVMRFDTDTKTWFYEQDDQSVALMSFEGEDANNLALFTTNGEKVTFDLTEEYTRQEARMVLENAELMSTTAAK